jgi:hypothetical protein
MLDGAARSEIDVREVWTDVGDDEKNEISNMTMTDTQLRLAPIYADEILPLELFMARTGLRKSSIRRMRRDGFVVRRVGRRSFVKGGDFIAWYDQHAPTIA